MSKRLELGRKFRQELVLKGVDAVVKLLKRKLRHTVLLLFDYATKVGLVVGFCRFCK